MIIRSGGCVDGRRRGLVSHVDGLSLLQLVETAPDHLEREVVVALLGEDPPESLDVAVVELSVAGGGPLGGDEALALEEPDLRDGDVGELALEQIEHVPDRTVLATHEATPTRPASP